MTQLVIHHYAAPRARLRLWVGIVIALGALLFVVEQGAAWFAAHPMAAHGLLGVIATGLAGAALPLALAGAAGAMLWVVGHELIPASHQPGRISAGNVGMAGGFAVMTALAALL